jgi:hypothetical protein
LESLIKKGKKMVSPYLAQQTVDDFGHRFSDIKFSVDLDPSTNTILTIPDDSKRYKMVIKAFPFDGFVWVALNATATPPSGNSFASTSSECLSLFVTCREVVAGDQINFFSTNVNPQAVSVVLYSLL